MSKIFFTSDLHLGHDREFIWKSRGFNSVDEMNTTIINNWNNLINEDDDVYILGDIMLGHPLNIQYLEKLNGKIHIVLGNHDTSNRKVLYQSVSNVVEIADVGICLKYNKYHFILTHYPLLTGNLENEDLTKMICNLYGHTHQTNNFYEDRPYMYHIGVDSHNCTPILLDDIIKEMNEKVTECLKFLDIDWSNK